MATAILPKRKSVPTRFLCVSPIDKDGNERESYEEFPLDLSFVYTESMADDDPYDVDYTPNSAGGCVDSEIEAFYAKGGLQSTDFDEEDEKDDDEDDKEDEEDDEEDEQEDEEDEEDEEDDEEDEPNTVVLNEAAALV